MRINYLLIILIVLFLPLFVLAQEKVIEFNLEIETKTLKEQLQPIELKTDNSVISLGLTSHHLPTALPLIKEFYQTIYLKNNQLKTFVIIGPDHLEKCKNLISLPKSAIKTNLGISRLDEKLIKEFTKINREEDCFTNEHSIGVQAAIIKYLFPKAKIVPILVSGSISEAEINNLVKLLNKYKKQLVIIGSVDFSHYLTYEAAQKIDQTSKLMLQKLNRNFTLKQVDSPATVKILIDLARLNNYKTRVVAQANSADFTKNKTDTTGYISAIFK